jgi:hypothetical protein
VAKPAQPVAVSTDFPGILTNVDPRDLPPGAAEEQINMLSIVSGELRVRAGIQEVTFEA